MFVQKNSTRRRTGRSSLRTSAALVLAVLTSAGVTTACGGSPAPSGNAGSPLLSASGPQRQQQLEDAARQEGALNWYTSLAGSEQEIIKAFNQKYPYIKVSVFRGAQDDVVTRVRQELAAHRPSADALEVTSDGIKLLDDAGQLADYVSPAAEPVPAPYKKTGNGNMIRYAADRISYISFGYNTQKVNPTQVPKTLQDLAKPELARQMSVASSTTGVRWVGSVLHELGEAQGTELLKTLARQGTRLQAVSGSALMGLIGSGEVGASPDVFHDHAKAQQDHGAPVKWAPIGPVIPNVGDVAILKSATHPAAAALMNEFLLSPEGQNVLERLGYASPDQKPDFTVWTPENDFPTVQQYQAAYRKWQDLMTSIFGG